MNNNNRELAKCCFWMDLGYIYLRIYVSVVGSRYLSFYLYCFKEGSDIQKYKIMNSLIS